MQKHFFSLFMTIIFILGAIGSQIANAETIYKVQKGDTLWDIAQVKDVTVDDLKTWNELNTSLIFPGQEIKVSAKNNSYIVQKGDTLSNIADAHQISLSDLKRWNNISSHLIFPGDGLTMTGDQQIAVSSNQTSTPQKQATPQNNTQETKETNATSTQAKEPTQQAPTTASGKEMTVTATAYTAYCEGCSGTTYTGINLRANPNQKVIAVDPSIIPLGSRVWVEGYGEAIAGDIGGAIKGNIIDVFIEHKQDALNWGRRTVKIKVLD